MLRHSFIAALVILIASSSGLAQIGKRFPSEKKVIADPVTGDALVLEANHDPMMLAQGPYPPSLKRRVGGAYGHLSNQQAAGFLQRIGSQRLQHLVVAHISEKNNSLELARAALGDAAAQAANCIFACQQEGFDWLQIEKAE